VPIARVSAGEFVVNAAATAKNRAQLEQINSGQQGNGGPVDLSASTISALAAETAASILNGANGTTLNLGRVGALTDVITAQVVLAAQRRAGGR
jgi:hypothetical protein